MNFEPAPAWYSDGTNWVLRVDQALVPRTPDGAAIGTSALNWSDLFLDSGGVINWDGGDVTLTHASNALTLGGGDFRVDDGFGVVIGHTAQVTGTAVSELQVLGTALVDSSIIIGAHSADAVGGDLAFIKGRDAIGTYTTAVSNNDVVGRIVGLPADATDSQTIAAVFQMEVDDASPAAGDVGMAFVWSQMAGGGAALAETMRITATGRLELSSATTVIALPDNRSIQWGDSNTASIKGNDEAAGDNMIFVTTASERMRIQDANVFIGDDANANMTVGLTINQGANDDQILAFKSSDVATALTTAPLGNDVETDDWLRVEKATALIGGARISALAEDGVLSPVLVFESYGGTATTTKTTAGRSLVEVLVAEHDGANALANITADGNIWGVRAQIGGSLTTRLMVDEDGDVFCVTAVDVTGTGNAVAATAFDEYDDAALLDTYDNLRAPDTAIRQDWAEWARYNEQSLLETGILGAPVEEGGMTNITQLQRAEVGAIRQLTEDLMSMAKLLPPKSRAQLTPRVQQRLLALEAA